MILQSNRMMGWWLYLQLMVTILAFIGLIIYNRQKFRCLSNRNLNKKDKRKKYKSPDKLLMVLIYSNF